jgi:hypothetical protein
MREDGTEKNLLPAAYIDKDNVSIAAILKVFNKGNPLPVPLTCVNMNIILAKMSERRDKTIVAVGLFESLQCGNAKLAFLFLSNS